MMTKYNTIRSLFHSFVHSLAVCVLLCDAPHYSSCKVASAAATLGYIFQFDVDFPHRSSLFVVHQTLLAALDCEGGGAEAVVLESGTLAEQRSRSGGSSLRSAGFCSAVRCRFTVDGRQKSSVFTIRWKRRAHFTRQRRRRLNPRPLWKTVFVIVTLFYILHSFKMCVFLRRKLVTSRSRRIKYLLCSESVVVLRSVVLSIFQNLQASLRQLKKSSLKSKRVD